MRADTTARHVACFVAILNDRVAIAAEAQQHEPAHRRPEAERNPGEQDRGETQNRELQRLVAVVVTIPAI